MKTLPKIEQPILALTVPSTKEERQFRPFRVKEEKLLLMAKESDTATDILTATKQLVVNCNLDYLDVDNLPLFDLEYLFLKLRSRSIDNIVKVAYRDPEDNLVYNFEIDLEEVEVHFPENKNNMIDIDGNSGILMKWPAANLYSDEEFLNLKSEHLFELIIRCVDKIYQGEEIFEAKDYTKEEISEYLEALDLKTFEKIEDFLLSTPSIRKELTYTNKNGKRRRIVLRSLNDFFTWR